MNPAWLLVIGPATAAVLTAASYPAQRILGDAYARLSDKPCPWNELGVRRPEGGGGL